MIHISPVFSRQSDRTLPMHRSLTPPARTGARSWFVSEGTLKSHLVGMVAEFVGTTLFLFFAMGGAQVASTAATSVAGGTQRSESGDAVDSVASVANTSNLLYIALSFGISLGVSVFIFGPISGGLLNPAASLCLALSGTIRPLRALLLSVAQFAGGIGASALVYGLLPGGFDVRTTLSKETSIVRGLFIEVLLTAFLMLTILFLAVEKNEAAPVAAFAIGLALFCAEMVGVNYTGGSLNPARSLGPGVLSRHFSGHFWIYIIGPGLGAALAAGLYRFFKFVDYKTCLKAHSQPYSDGKPLPTSLSTPPSFPELPFRSASRRPAGVSIEKAEPRDPRVHLRSVPSAATLSPAQLDRIEAMLSQLLEGNDAVSREEAGEMGA
ncbi:hypothetical protein JCM6882_000932 [Rhodosporidiobolus microsporus]